MKSASVAHLPRPLKEELAKVAKQNERSMAGELRVAVKAHLLKHGK